MGRNENALLREAVNDDKDGGVSAGEGKVFNESMEMEFQGRSGTGSCWRSP